MLLQDAIVTDVIGPRDSCNMGYICQKMALVRLFDLTTALVLKPFKCYNQYCHTLSTLTCTECMRACGIFYRRFVPRTGNTDTTHVLCCYIISSMGPFYQHGLTLTPAWISNCIHYNMWDEITYPFLNFNGATVEVEEWISNFILHFSGYVITHPCWD